MRRTMHPPTTTSQKYPPILKLGSPQAAQLITGGKCFIGIGMHVQVTWALKCNDFYHVTARKQSSRVGIPPFRLHLESN